MSHSDEFMLSEGERQVRRKRRRRLLIIGIALLIVLAIGAVLARPVRRSIRAWQARRHAEKAFAFIDAQKWSEARDEATAAYQLQPKEPAAVRSVARLLSRAGQADGLEFWKNLAELTPLTRDDLRDEARLALRVNDTARAAEAAQHLLNPKEGGPTPGDWLIAAELAMRKQAFDEARQLSDKVLADSRASQREQLQALLILTNIARNGGTDIDLGNVNEQLVAFANGNDDVALDALVLLAQQALVALQPTGGTQVAGALGNQGRGSVGSTPSQTPIVPPEEILHAIENHPLAKATHKLLATDLEIAQHRDQRDEILKRTIDHWKNSDSESLLALAAWLYRNGEFQRLVDAIPLDRALQTRELFLQHVDALAALSRWNDIRKIIETERFPLDPVIEHMYLARCFAQQGQENGAENNWQRALESAAGDPNKLIMLGEYAEKNDALLVAAKAFDAAVAASPKLRSGQQGRLRLAYRSRDTRRVHAILLDLSKIWPDDPAVQNDEAYVRLLLLPSVATADGSSKIEDGKPSPSASASAISNLPSSSASPAAELHSIELLAERLIATEPASLPHRTVLALARLKQGKPAQALAVYENLRIPQNAMFPAAVAVHAAVLDANGKHYEAEQESAQLQSSRLLPEEDKLRPLQIN